MAYVKWRETIFLTHNCSEAVALTGLLQLYVGS